MLNDPKTSSQCACKDWRGPILQKKSMLCRQSRGVKTQKSPRREGLSMNEKKNRLLEFDHQKKTSRPGGGLSGNGGELPKKAFLT